MNIQNFDITLTDPDAFVDGLENKIQVQHEMICPQPGGQTDFLSRREFELFFGGAAGGGKSAMLVLDALGIQFQYEQFGIPAYQHSRYRAVLFRRNSTRLQNLIDEAKRQYFGLGALFTLQRKGEPGSSFTFPSGAKIFLSHLEQESDVENHQGMEYQYVGFDELPQFSLKQYLYLMSRLRGVVMNNGASLDKRIRGTGNPIGEGLWWVKKRFIKSDSLTMLPGKTYFFIADPSCEPEENPTGIRVLPSDPRFIHAKSRTFVPAFLNENKILMEADPGYAASIMQLGAKMEKALLNGDWDAFGGDFFDMFDKERSKEEPFDIPDNWRLTGCIDPGWANPAAFHLIAREPDGTAHLLFTYNRSKADPETHSTAIYSLIKNFPYTQGRMPDMIVAGADAFAKKDRYGTKQTELTFADIFMNNGLYLQPAVTDRIIGWWVMKQYFASQKFKYFEGFADVCINELVSIQTDEDNPEEVKGYRAGSTPYHNSDALRYGLMALPIPFSKHQKFIPVDFDYDKKKRQRKSKTTIMSE